MAPQFTGTKGASVRGLRAWTAPRHQLLADTALAGNEDRGPGRGSFSTTSKTWCMAPLRATIDSKPAAREKLLPEQLVVLRQDPAAPRQLALLDGGLHQRDQLGRERGRLLHVSVGPELQRLAPDSSLPKAVMRYDFHLRLRGLHLAQTSRPSPPVRIRRSVITTFELGCRSARSTPETSGARSTT